jgi:hypothetical protein
MFDVDKGVIVPFELTQNGHPWDLTLATGVDLLLNDGSPSKPLAVTDATHGLCEYTADGSIRAGYKRAQVRLTFDATHVYHFPAFDFHVSSLFGIGP